jgi:hypothetical protein
VKLREAELSQLRQTRAKWVPPNVLQPTNDEFIEERSKEKENGKRDPDEMALPTMPITFHQGSETGSIKPIIG